MLRIHEWCLKSVLCCHVTPWFIMGNLCNQFKLSKRSKSESETGEGLNKPYINKRWYSQKTVDSGSIKSVRWIYNPSSQASDQVLQIVTALGDIGAVSDQWLDPLSHTTPSTSSNKSRSLGTPMADPCCWGQLQESGLSGPTPTWPGSVKTRRRSTWFKLLPKTCWQG